MEQESEDVIRFKWNHYGMFRRFQLKLSTLNAKSFFAVVYEIDPHFDSAISYSDVEGEDVTFSTDPELDQIVDQMRSCQTAVINIKTMGQNKRFKALNRPASEIAREAFDKVMWEQGCSLEIYFIDTDKKIRYDKITTVMVGRIGDAYKIVYYTADEHETFSHLLNYTVSSPTHYRHAVGYQIKNNDNVEEKCISLHFKEVDYALELVKYIKEGKRISERNEKNYSMSSSD